MEDIEVVEGERSRSSAFVALLIKDVIAARERLNAASTQTARRDVVRTSLAAIEGMMWIAREHVRTALADLEQLTPVADLALRERTYAVSEQGQLTERTAGLPLLTAIRLVVSQAKIVSPAIAVEFSGAGWRDLRQSIEVRNRITHPKPDQDLGISDDDLAAVGSGLSWLVATLNYLMASTNLALTQFNDHLRDTVQRLTSGDPEALAEYYAALHRADEE
jgi:hypothetical protein